MSKAILVMDMPMACVGCCIGRCIYEKGEIIMHCSASSGMAIGDEAYTRQDWCPLKEVPEKKEFTYGVRVFGKSFTCGYNTCIDEILGGGE